MTVAIKVENLSKKYLIKHESKSVQYDTFSETLIQGSKNVANKIIHPFSGKELDSQTQEEFWALKDINFEINQGDKVGIIGRNGAGKSTLLKILSRITDPTSGKIHINGRIASLLEVGTGFHPELTGRENIFLNGAILGMSRREIKSKFDEIVDFAEVDKFLDTPVKRYSSGMYVRLAFSVAAHLEPEILVVDEVLAVGDAQFQKKCLGKMDDVSKEGRTILFVSHNISSVNALCTTGMELESGRIKSIGSIDEVIKHYVESGVGKLNNHYKCQIEKYSKNKAQLLEVFILDSTNKKNSNIFINDDFVIHIKWKLNVEVPYLRLGLEFSNSIGIVTFVTIDTDTNGLHGKKRKPGIYHQYVTIPKFTLTPSIYNIMLFAGMPQIERIMEKKEVVSFEVIENNTHLSLFPGEKRLGYIATPVEWK